ncbi:CHAP domain-containing protein [Calidifontibacter terrae]
MTPACATPIPGRAVGQKSATNTGYGGQCTWGAMEQWRAATGYYPYITGNAKDWAASARAHGWTVVLDAQPRCIVVFQPGVQGADRTYGHVAWVTSIQRRADGLYVTFTEMNGPAGPWRYDVRTVKNVVGMSYILAP